MTLNYSMLLRDLYVAFASAARHKGKMSYVRRFRAYLRTNLACLALVLILRLYVPLPSKCFIVFRPKQREVFAAQFPDRVVHHLYFNMTHLLYEATFIRDSYSCIDGRGTLDGILRLAQHIRQESLNYTRECCVLKLDIRGYFMHIDRRKRRSGVCSFRNNRNTVDCGRKQRCYDSSLLRLFRSEWCWRGSPYNNQRHSPFAHHAVRFIQRLFM